MIRCDEDCSIKSLRARCATLSYNIGMEILLVLGSVSIGFLLGALFKNAVFESQDWQIMRWDSHVLGYRPVAVGTNLHTGEDVVMSLPIDTRDFPEEGRMVE